jgi:hypothetical protein
LSKNAGSGSVLNQSGSTTLIYCTYRLKQKGERNPDFTKALIKEKLKDQDQEIATTSCKVTLACPLGKMRMNLPCRATTCDHLQCFDAALYLMMNEKKPKVLLKLFELIIII